MSNTKMRKFNNEVSDSIRDARLKSGLNQSRVGFLCGWPQQKQSDIEVGRCQISVAQVYALANAMRVEVKDLLP